MDWTQTGIIISGQSVPGSNANERQLHIRNDPGLKLQYKRSFSVVSKILGGRGSYTSAYSTAPDN